MDRGDEEVVSGAAAPRRFRLTWAESRGPLRRAAIALYAPAVAPFLLSPLAECSHCVRSYLAIVPVLPGFFAAAWVGNEPLAFYALALVVTLALLTAVAVAIGLAGRRWPLVAIPIALLAAAQATGIGHLLRA